mgnify:CR=1 FL=1
MRYLYSVIWLGAFGYLAFLLYTHENFSQGANRKSQLGAMIFDSLIATLGHAGAAALAILIGIGVAFWASRPDKAKMS